MSSPTIVFVAGCWLAKTHIEPVIPYFTNARYRIIPQTLKGAGGEIESWLDDADMIQSIVTKELKNQDVVLILHSLSIFGGLEAVNRIALNPDDHIHKISRIIVVSGVLEMDALRKVMIEGGFNIMDMEAMKSYAGRAYESLFNDLSAKEAKPFVDALCPQSIWPQPAELTSDRWSKAAPTTYVMGDRDRMIPPDVSEEMAKKYGMELVHIDSGHCPYTTQPARFVEVVDGILKG